LSDLAVLAAAPGSVPGEATWNPPTDLDVNGTVDVHDAEFQVDFGDTCS
jgi:hypothetical protein